MAVRVFCSSCDVFIKDVDIPELQRLTGKEKCEECGKKIAGLYQVLDELIAKYNAAIDKGLGLANKKFGTLDAAHTKFFNDGQSLYKTVRAEIDSHLLTILEGKSEKE